MYGERKRDLRNRILSVCFCIRGRGKQTKKKKGKKGKTDPTFP